MTIRPRPWQLNDPNLDRPVGFLPFWAKAEEWTRAATPDDHGDTCRSGYLDTHCGLLVRRARRRSGARGQRLHRPDRGAGAGEAPSLHRQALRRGQTRDRREDREHRGGQAATRAQERRHRLHRAGRGRPDPPDGDLLLEDPAQGGPGPQRPHLRPAHRADVRQARVRLLRRADQDAAVHRRGVAVRRLRQPGAGRLLPPARPLRPLQPVRQHQEAAVGRAQGDQGQGRGLHLRRRAGRGRGRA